MSSRPLTDHLTAPITLRGASPDDQTALRRLAALDSASLPSAPVMIGEVDGELRAAVSIADSTAIADPFYRRRAAPHSRSGTHWAEQSAPAAFVPVPASLGTRGLGLATSLAER